MAARSAAIAFATAGMVLGLYHRCGFGVAVGRPSRFCTTMTLRDELGAAFSRVFMNVSYPTPFWTTSWAPLTSRATDALASKVCGSVFGLLMMALTWTYFPPTWLMTFAYSFSAPTATITPEPDGPAARDEEQALASSATPSVMRAVSDLRWLRIADAPRCRESCWFR